MKEILFLNPVFKETLWGGNRLKTDYNYNIPSDHTGECWAISAHSEGDCTIEGGSYEGWQLSELWDKHREVFGNSKAEKFPLLVKLIDAREDLSIQVHPDDAYANAHEHGASGKTECWYILDCPKDATIVVGHKAKDKEELRKMVDNGCFQELISTRAIKKGDFLQITPGTLHAIKAGTLLLETQQSSDVTYRVYDYNRLHNGKPRELHLQKSMDVIACPYKEAKEERKTTGDSNCTIEELVSCQFYTVRKIVVHGTTSMLQNEGFLLCSIIHGKGTLDQYEVKKGDHFIIPSDYGEFVLEGDMEMIVSNT